MSETSARAADDLPDLADLVQGVDAGLSDADLAVALVQRAGRLAADLRAGGLEAERKTSVSDLVTAADRAAEAFVTQALARTRPDDGLVGEEGASRPSRSGRSWVVDPVDGTYNFHSGAGYWCSALALRDAAGAPVLGAVHQPVSGETWIGGPDLPTTLDGRQLPAVTDLPASHCGFGTYLHPTALHVPDLREPWMAMTSQVATVRMLGSSSVDLASVATGRLGVWAQHSVLDWDWYPGASLVLGAGGRTQVLEHRGRRWHLGGSPSAVEDLSAALLAS